MKGKKKKKKKKKGVGGGWWGARLQAKKGTIQYNEFQDFSQAASENRNYSIMTDCMLFFIMKCTRNKQTWEANQSYFRNFFVKITKLPLFKFKTKLHLNLKG